MGLSGFHPIVSRWFSDTLGAPTSAQLRGWAAIREGRHTLIAAPTGSGKTLAAFLTAIDDLYLHPAEISPVSAADFMRFLFAWQHVSQPAVLTGVDGLRAILAQLDGVELPARAWERHLLPARLDRYDAAMLDMLCLTGEVTWARLSTGPTPVVGATPIALFLREHAEEWLSLRESPVPTHENGVLEYLRLRGASFSHEIAAACGLNDEEFRAAIGELVSAGLVTSDGFAGLRTLVGVASHSTSGRWSELRSGGDELVREKAVETLGRVLLRRYGVMFRRLLAREAANVPWRELARVYRRLEARGEIRGGRFVSGMSGEQFALPDAVDRLREVRRSTPDDRLITLSAVDPLNLTGIITAGDRVAERDSRADTAEDDLLRVRRPAHRADAHLKESRSHGVKAPHVEVGIVRSQLHHRRVHLFGFEHDRHVRHRDVGAVDRDDAERVEGIAPILAHLEGVWRNLEPVDDSRVLAGLDQL